MKRSFIISYVVTVAFISAQSWLLAPDEAKRATAATPPLKPLEALEKPDVSLNASDNETTVRVAVDRTVSLQLPENPTTGYQWEIADATPDFETGVRKLLSESMPPAPQPGQETIVGAPGTFQLLLRTEKPGTYPLTLVYRRSWEKETPPAQTFKITLEVFRP